MTQEQSPFGKVTVSAAIPGLPYSQVVVEVKEGFNPFVAARTFVTRMEETFGKDAIAAALAQSKAAGAPSAAASAPVCNLHNKPMKESKKPGAWYCPAKLADGSYCTEKVG